MSNPAAALRVSDARENAPLPRWPLAVAIIAALLMGAGALIAITRPQMLAANGNEITEPVRVYAGYLFSRNLAVAGLLLTAVALRAHVALANFLLVAALIQFFDSVLDCFEGRWSLIPGIILIGVVCSMAATRVSGHPFWKRSFWLSKV